MMRSPWIGALVAVGFTVLTIPSWVSLLSAPEHAPYRALAIVLATGHGIAMIAAALLTNMRGALALRVAPVVIVAALGASLVIWLGIGSAPVLAGALCLMLVLLPRKPGLIAAATSLVILGAFGFVRGTPEKTVPNVVVLLAVVIATVLVLRLVEVNEQLVEAKEAFSDLAVLRERERMSRELHDVLGSSATTIALKARLTAELVSRSEHHRTLAELEDINLLASTISRDLRETVRDLRQTTLEAELLAADAVAKAAGIRLDVHRSGTPEARFDPVLAMIVRESVTNAVRHAGASLISVTVNPDGVTIAEDGRGTPLVEGEGIRGMREPLAVHNGTLTVDSGQGDGTVVIARLP